ncbi:MAG: GGDEF domain-containing protein [Gammaproteobacteria bacterium]|nr:GGDEF domain-containing protein [Gammaproteobacteria bacterium]MDH5304084.1 GGDEF domain-containing protein [Gammaproteobacteria bacterium]
MTMSPLTYIQVASGTTSLIIAIIFFMAWKTLGDRPWAMRWSLAFLFSTLYWLAMLGAGRFPSHASFWLLANAFGIATITLALRGHCQRTQCERLPKNLWPIASLIFAGVAWTTLVQPHAGLSAAILPFAAAVSLLMSATMVIRHREQTRVAEWASAITMILFALVQLPAAWHIYGLGPDRDLVMSQLFSHASVMFIPAGLIGMAMFVMFMLASDLYEDMKEIAVRDPLTGLLNRRGFGEQTIVAYATARRTVQPVSVIAADIDHFKSVNDEFGHNIGDKALVHFSRLLMAERRVEDIVARIGGEEFLLVLPGTDIAEASAIADELCERLAASPMAVDERKVVMTASFGVAAISDKDASLADVVIKADRALYRSKRAGRNRVDLESSQTLRALDGSLKTGTI